MDNQGNVSIIRSATEARQGVTGHKVRYVLIWGTSLAVLAMMALGAAAGLGYFY